LGSQRPRSQKRIFKGRLRAYCQDMGPGMSRILVADDSRFKIALLSAALLEKGFEVVVAEDAAVSSKRMRQDY
jgi:PleD family two-component response regulator